tara:strand:+ start:1045 stop:1485 length:441 start_codon:yes stop_codon:yes gene_type:complete
MKRTTFVDLEGANELQKMLNDLGQEAIKDSQIKQGLRKLAKPFIEDIRFLINDVTKNLSRSIGIIKGVKTKRGRPYILIGPRYYGNYKGYHAHLVEEGKEYYDVTFDAQRNIERAFDKNKTQTIEKLKSEIVNILDKKIKKKLKQI